MTTEENARAGTRRGFLRGAAATAGIAAAGALLPSLVLAQGAKLRVGLMLPYTGTYSQLGAAIENGLRLALGEGSGRPGGREIEFFKVDDESDPAKATDNANRLITRDKVDVLVGSVHSGVAMGMLKVAR
jgi:branched-chain amino acid transport system substrate-binding protein